MCDTEPGHMILVEHVDVRMCNRISTVVAHANLRGHSFSKPSLGAVEPLPYTTETVRGKRFRRVDGSFITIGLTKEVEKILGSPFQAIDELNDRADDAHTMIWALRREVKDLEQCRRKLHELRTMPWWKRLAFVWSGKRGLDV